MIKSHNDTDRLTTYDIHDNDIQEEATMTDIIVKGNKTKAKGYLPEIGDKAADFKLTKTDLSDIGLGDFKGKNIILNIFPSIDTAVCAASVRRFNTEVAKIDGTVVLCVSLDLPFAHGRFCAAEGINNVISVSAFRSPDFIKNYGLVIDEGPLKGLLARYVVAIDTTGTIVYSETSKDLSEEPDYEEVVACITKPMKEVSAPASSDKKQLPLDRCVYPETAEDSRIFNDDEPCDDGRAG
jgi:thiol peroxidase